MGDGCSHMPARGEHSHPVQNERGKDTRGQTAGEAESNKIWQALHFCTSYVMV